ncbi:MAG: hypothetical protein ACJAYU_000541 [Bradymonadia bacterium]|jgi:hypothetical protein
MRNNAAFLFALILVLPACGNDTPAAFGCPSGQVLSERGFCVEATDTGGVGPNRDIGGAGDTTGMEDGATPDIEEDLPADCTPGETVCSDGTTVRLCNETGDGWEFLPCGESEICSEGVCVLSTTEECTPGEVFGCGSTVDLLICADNGVDRELDPCPAEIPNCFDGACTAASCEPGNRRCDGNEIIECDADGETESSVALCEFGCSAGRCVDPCASDGKDYLGCTFWAADLDNIGPDASAAQFGITISNATLDAVDVEIARGDGTVVREITIPTGELETVLLDRQDVDDTDLTYNTYRVTSGAPITVHQFNPLSNGAEFSNDASLLLPSTSVGNEYIVVGWPTITADADLRAYVAIIAPGEGTTRVTITSPVRTIAGGSVPALQANVPTELSLEQGQILSIMTEDLAATGLTGMEIISDKDVVVFSGHECANIPVDNNFCDHLEQQLLPTDTWGSEFVGAKFNARGGEPDVWRVVAAEDGTTIVTNPPIPGVNGLTLGRGEMREFITTEDFIVSATGPIQLAQFMVGSAYPGPSGGCDLTGLFPNYTGCVIPRTCDSGTAIGDPAFLINVPNEQFREDYLVLTPALYQQDFMTIIAPPGTRVELDGREVTAARERIGAWEIMRITAVDGVHRIVADNNIGLYAYGYDCDVSYAYPGGLNLNSL